MADPTLDKARKRGELFSRDNYGTRYMSFDDGGGVHLSSGIANNFCSAKAASIACRRSKSKNA